MVAGDGVINGVQTAGLVCEVWIEWMMAIALATACRERHQVSVLVDLGPHLYAQVEILGRANLAWRMVKTRAPTRLETPGAAT